MKALALFLTAALGAAPAAHAAPPEDPRPMRERSSEDRRTMCELLAAGARKGLSRPSVAGTSFAYVLNNFLGSFELRFQFLEDGVQLAFFSVSSRTHFLAMRKILDAVLSHEFGPAYRRARDARIGSDTDLHSWIAVEPTPLTRDRIRRVLDLFRELPQIRRKPWRDWNLGAGELRAIERYAGRYFPQVPESRMVRRVQELLPYFIGQLGVTERMLVDGSLIDAGDSRPAPFLETLFAFLYGEELDTAAVRAGLHQRFLDFLGVSVRDGGGAGHVPFDAGDEPVTVELESSVVEAEVYQRARLGSSLGHHVRDSSGFGFELAPPQDLGGMRMRELTDLEEQFPADETHDHVAFSALRLTPAMRRKLGAIAVDFAFQLANYPARALVEKYGLTRDEMVTLMNELNVHGLELYFDGSWDRANMRLRRDMPEYYRHRHTPRTGLIHYLEFDPATGVRRK